MFHAPDLARRHMPLQEPKDGPGHLLRVDSAVITECLARGRRKTCLNLVLPWFSAERLLEDRKLPEGFH